MKATGHKATHLYFGEEWADKWVGIPVAAALVLPEVEVPVSGYSFDRAADLAEPSTRCYRYREQVQEENQSIVIC